MGWDGMGLKWNEQFVNEEGTMDIDIFLHDQNLNLHEINKRASMKLRFLVQWDGMRKFIFKHEAWWNEMRDTTKWDEMNVNKGRSDGVGMGKPWFAWDEHFE